MDELEKALADIDKIPLISESAKENLRQGVRRKYALRTQAGAVRDPETGLFKANHGKLYETLEEAQRGSEEARRMAELEETEEKTEAQLGELQQLIQRSGRAQRQMAERVGARQQGQLMSQLQRSILGTGGEAQTLEEEFWKPLFADTNFKDYLTDVYKIGGKATIDFEEIE